MPTPAEPSPPVFNSFQEFDFCEIMQTDAQNLSNDEIKALMSRAQELRVSPPVRRAAKAAGTRKINHTAKMAKQGLSMDELLNL